MRKIAGLKNLQGAPALEPPERLAFLASNLRGPHLCGVLLSGPQLLGSLGGRKGAASVITIKAHEDIREVLHGEGAQGGLLSCAASLIST